MYWRSLHLYLTKIASITFSRAIDAVNPEVSMATTSGSGLETGRMCLEGTYIMENIHKIDNLEDWKIAILVLIIYVES